MPTDMLLEFPDEIREQSEDTIQLRDDMFAKANQMVEGHGVEKEPAPPPAHVLEVPPQNAANSMRGVCSLVSELCEEFTNPAPVIC
jgi:hypothetical protein